MSWTGGEHTEAARKRISEAARERWARRRQAGWTMSLEQRQKLSDSNTRAWTTTRRGWQPSEETRMKMSISAKQRIAEGRGGGFRKGYQPSPETLAKMRANHADVNGERNPGWRGGTSQNYHPLTRTVEWRQWARMVRLRDDYTCRTCGLRKTRMDAHHLVSAMDFPERRFDLENGITLCQSCHAKEHQHTSARVLKVAPCV